MKYIHVMKLPVKIHFDIDGRLLLLNETIWPPHTKFPVLWGKVKQALFGVTPIG